jgi:hypothetical protein
VTATELLAQSRTFAIRPPRYETATTPEQNDTWRKARHTYLSGHLISVMLVSTNDSIPYTEENVNALLRPLLRELAKLDMLSLTIAVDSFADQQREKYSLVRFSERDEFVEFVHTMVKSFISADNDRIGMAAHTSSGMGCIAVHHVDPEITPKFDFLPIWIGEGYYSVRLADVT